MILLDEVKVTDELVKKYNSINVFVDGKLISMVTYANAKKNYIHFVKTTDNDKIMVDENGPVQKRGEGKVVIAAHKYYFKKKEK